MRGWTPLFYLFAISEKALLDKTSRTIDFLQILQADNSIFLDLEARDHQDMTVLSYVVRYGTGEEVQALLGLGALLFPSIAKKKKTGSGYSKPDEEIDPWQLPNSAISQAIASANISTFCALLETVPRDRIDSTYAGGWTMLHYAACLGRDDMVRCLLGAGAEAFYVDLREELEREVENTGDFEGQRLSLTYDTYNRYLRSLEYYGLVAIRAPDEEEGQNGQEVFWDAGEVQQ
jgi:ankyrin repeat protein